MEHLGGELLSAVATVAGALGMSGLVRAWIRHRTRLHLERERSTRAATRAAGLARLLRGQGDLRIDERDQDGHRVVVLRRPTRSVNEQGGVE